MDSIKDVVRSSVKVPEFDKHLKKARGHVGRNVVEITIKMKAIVRKPLMIKINKLRLSNLDNSVGFVLAFYSCLIYAVQFDMEKQTSNIVLRELLYLKLLAMRKCIRPGA